MLATLSTQRLDSIKLDLPQGSAEAGQSELPPTSSVDRTGQVQLLKPNPTTPAKPAGAPDFAQLALRGRARERRAVERQLDVRVHFNVN